MSVAASIPPIMVVPITFRATAPDPVARQRSAALIGELGELDDEDRVLRGHADGHDEADLGVDVFSMPRAQKGRERAKDCHGCAKQDAERQRPAFVERREDEESEEQRHPEDNSRRDALLRFLFLEGHSGVI